jgi:hypothetical protein
MKRKKMKSKKAEKQVQRNKREGNKPPTKKKREKRQTHNQERLLCFLLRFPLLFSGPLVVEKYPRAWTTKGDGTHVIVRT